MLNVPCNFRQENVTFRQENVTFKHGWQEPGFFKIRNVM
ncbi:hypothetical protein DCCM_3043 [Desulfocucumis palustris]|uniref:Uncharacterized protein n=1 Tax=Desulfocucumis palustris TaxID=1898651 RepID=A0A2L2XCT4_9FIRM|nr:hypothetical protein DCCM_3043 [Desulfocucumis palustris]